MLTLHSQGFHVEAEAGDFDPHTTWIDLLNPTRDEELKLEAQLGVLLPTREDMDEIETSSRLYIDDGAAFMTAQVAYFGGSAQLQSGPVTFVLTAAAMKRARRPSPVLFSFSARKAR